MATILNIETSSPVCSIALGRDGELLDMIESSEGNSHAKYLTVYVQEIMQRNKLSINDLDAVAVSGGPGSYTGLRIGVSAAKGLCFGGDCALIAVDTLQLLAAAWKDKYQNEFKEDQGAYLCPMIDARRMEVYSAFYDFNLNKKSDIQPLVVDENTFAEIKDRQIIIFGNGADKCNNVIKHDKLRFSEGVEHTSSAMVSLSEKAFNKNNFEDVAYYEPFYLKEFMATKPKTKVLG